MNFNTVHYATWQYVFDADVLHDDYADEVRDKLQTKVTEVLADYPDVYENTQFCCQAEGFEIQSENLDSLYSAARKLQFYFQRFKKITEV